MSTQKSYPIFKFASLRNPDEVGLSPDSVIVSPETDLVTTLISINEDTIPNAEKLSQFNDELQDFVDGDSFIKTKVQFDDLKAAQDADPSEEDINILYNNVLVRAFTKSTTNRMYKMVVDQLKSIYSAVHGTEIDLLKLVVPERLNLSFTGYISPDAEEVEEEDLTTIVDQLNSLTALQGLIDEAKEENVVAFVSESSVRVRDTEYSSVMDALQTSSISVDDAEAAIDEELSRLSGEMIRTKTFYQNPDEMSAVDSTISAEDGASPVGIREAHMRYSELKTQVEKARDARLSTFNTHKSVSTDKYASVAAIAEGEISIDEAENYVQGKMATLSGDFGKLAKNKKYSKIGDHWVETTKYDAQVEHELTPYLLDDLHTDCNLKFPFQIADLRVVEQEPVGYLPGEIAHVSNTQAGEKNTRVTRRLKKVENYESLLSDEETFRETDTQSTEKFSLEREASNVQNQSQNFNVNTSASASFGAYELSIDAGYSNTSSSTSSNSTSQSHAKEVVKNIVDRVSNRIKTERSTRTIEEFEETVTHEIDNGGQGTKSYVYRWLNKLVRATLKNYGKRLIYQFDVAHPSHYYLSRSIKNLPSLSLPPDPRELSVDGTKVLAIENLTRDNYLAWGAIYKTELEQPPAKKIIVSETFTGDTKMSSSKMIAIKEGYECKTARLTNYVHNIQPGPHTILTIGNSFYAQWGGGGTMWSPTTHWLKNETDQLAVSILAGNEGFSANIEVNCELTQEAYMAWKIKVYNALVAAYEGLKAEADSQMAAFDPNLPGLHPAKKKQLIIDEIKRETIRKMFRCNPFWINDNYTVGNEYDANCCQDSLYAEKVRFLESVFDWNNMTYKLHPYFYANKSNWSQLLDLSDDDPHFEAFLRSSYATIQVPVHRDSLKEIAAANFIKNNSIANYETVPEDMQEVLEELSDIQPTQFTHDLEGNELAEPTSTVDLGIFNLPTSLVILECGTADGVKPIGFPQSEDDPESNVVIPKQYSPAIIADSCDV